MIAGNAIVAALYVVLTLITLPISYEYMQVRVSEFLMLLVFFNPSYTIGLTLGCLIANLFSTVGPLDIVLGTAATLIACLLMNLLSMFIKSLLINALIPCFVNALIVPLIIYLSAGGEIAFSVELFFVMFGWVFLGEFIAIICIGYPLFMIILHRYKSFHKMIVSTRNLDFKF